MTELDTLLLQAGATLRDAIEVIDMGSIQIALVVDEEQRLLGTVTDGDVRRGLLRGETLDSLVQNIMNTNFFSLPANSSDQKVETTMRDYLLHQIPGLDKEGRVQNLFLQKEMLPSQIEPNWVVLMAGGQGKRMGPVTESCPKPMLHVSGKPILEILLEQCIKAGFRKFFISVNYLKKQIMEYFADGNFWGVEILYLEEEHPLGTAGALSLLPEKLSNTLLVINGDVLTRVDFSSLLRFHCEHQASATLCVQEDKTCVPYGVITSKDYQMESMQEKPVISNHIVAGIYALEPHVLQLLPPNQYFDMPNLLEEIKAQGNSVFVFPIYEFWIDVGQPASLERANGEWKD